MPKPIICQHVLFSWKTTNLKKLQFSEATSLNVFEECFCRKDHGGFSSTVRIAVPIASQY